MTKRDRAKQITREHAAVRSTIEDIRGEIGRLRNETGPSHPAGELPKMLKEFSVHLRSHFAFEEQGGFVDEGGAVPPGTQRAIERALGQHQGLEQQLAALIDGAERAGEGRACLSDSFVESLESFLVDLLEHESCENELIHDLVVQDVGGGD